MIFSVFMILSLIAAASDNRVIGNKGEIPWKLPADLKYFRQKTEGHPIIMGRKTFQSIGKPLPKRRNIVISRHEFPGKPLEFDVAHSLEDAIAIAKKDNPEEIFVIGGGEIYKQALPLADRIYFTHIHGIFDGDAFFPQLDPKEWVETARDDHNADAENPHDYSFITYERQTA